MKPTFVTIYPYHDAPALLKDPGIIPLYLTQYGYESTFVSFIPESVSSDAAELQEFKRNVHAILLKDDRRNRKKIPVASSSILRYIWKNARKIDILNLYFLKHSIVYGLLYKLCHPHGLLYVKLDMDHIGFERSESQWIEPLRRWVFSLYLKYVPDVVSAETQASYKYVKRRFLPKGDKLIIVPDGLDNSLIERKGLRIAPFSKRDNIFLTVGRIGTLQKNTELLLSAAKEIKDWKDWKLYIIGPIAPDFQQTIESFYQENPNLKDKVLFKGPIYDKGKLFELYNHSKVFCLSSRWESFGIVNVEAQFFGNYILSTPISSIDDFIEDDARLGTIVHDAKEIGQKMQDIIDGKMELSESFDVRVTHGELFRWSLICQQLDEKLRYFRDK